jgi:hypothetical protein
MDFPKLQADQHAVITAEVSTGIVLQLNGQRRLADSAEAWRVFNSLTAAREFAVAEVGNNPEIEFVICDREQTPIQVVRHEKYNHLA